MTDEAASADLGFAARRRKNGELEVLHRGRLACTLPRRESYGVGFDEARSVFVDERAKLLDDPDHSDQEERFILLGLSSVLRLLLVATVIGAKETSFESSLPARRR